MGHFHRGHALEQARPRLSWGSLMAGQHVHRWRGLFEFAVHNEGQCVAVTTVGVCSSWSRQSCW